MVLSVVVVVTVEISFSVTVTVTVTAAGSGVPVGSEPASFMVVNAGLPLPAPCLWPSRNGTSVTGIISIPVGVLSASVEVEVGGI